jgi:heme exporter protein A
MFAKLMADHLANGGLIIAATHMPLGVAAKELRLEGAR